MSRTCRIVLAVAFALPVETARAQFSSAIQGVVTDQSAAVVPGVAVRVANLATGVVREVVTSADGIYRALSLGAGVYRVEVSKEGFRSAQRDRIEVGVSESVRVDFNLPVGALSEKIDVVARAPVVETEQGRVSGRIDRTQLNDVPLNGRNLYNLIALQPGVVGKGISAALGAGGSGNDAFSGEANPQAYASGQRTEANNFTVDESSVNSAARGGITNLTPNADSVEEVRVVANNFSAVEGRNSGAQIQVITKSGSNTFHGGASYYFTNNTFASRSVFESAVPVFRRNQFGYNIGGPIVKNRTFFFHSYEGLRQSGARGAIATVETPEFRDWVARTLPNNISAKLLRDFQPSVYPTFSFRTAGSPRAGTGQVAPPDTLLAFGSAQFVPEAFRNGNQITLRIDHELRPGKDRLYGNLYRTTSSTLNGGIRPAFIRPTDEITYFASLNETHTFGPNMLNEFRFGLMRLRGLPRIPKHLEVPGISITGLTGFSTSSYPQGWFQTNFSYKDIFSWIRSSHTLKMGAELRRVRSNSKNTNNYVPAYTFANILEFAYDDVLQQVRKVDPRTGIPATNVVGLRGWEWALFFNDDWKVTRNFTLNMGLRYENYGSPTEINGLLRNLVLGNGASFSERVANGRADIVDTFFPTDNNNFAPRFGFAWNPDGNGKTAIRGGYGIAYDRLFMTPLLDFRDSPPLRADATLGRQFGTRPVYTLGDPAKPYMGYPLDPALQLGLDSRNGIKGARVSMKAVNPNTTTSYVHNWFFGIQRDIGRGVVLEGNYLGSAGHHLYNTASSNRYRGDLLDNLFAGLNPSFATVNMIESSSNSIHHGGTMQARKLFAQGFTIQGAFSFGKTINDSDDLVNVATYQDVASRRLDRALAGFDVPRKFSMVAVWEVPFLRGAKTPASRVVGGWQLSGTVILQKGSPMSVYTTAPWPRGDYNADGYNWDRPNAPAAGVKQSGWDRIEFQSGIFRAADFTPPQPGANGTLGRNTFRGPGYAQVDFSLSKKFAVTERFSTQLRVDAFNALARVNLNNPVLDLVNNNFGRSTSSLTPKSIQLGLRATF
ncbi:MAG: carboxypeptidase regulatory-like domain-containing protein [Bryobacterales bacterium]|nr:carboxypeptidase regulatory-like domain-containing protein [Bryobacterales bacterium]